MNVWSWFKWVYRDCLILGEIQKRVYYNCKVEEKWHTLAIYTVLLKKVGSCTFQEGLFFFLCSVLHAMACPESDP